jgi:hypothetical protein
LLLKKLDTEMIPTLFGMNNKKNRFYTICLAIIDVLIAQLLSDIFQGHYLSWDSVIIMAVILEELHYQFYNK